MTEPFIEIDTCQITKSGQRICGDVFLLNRSKENGRVIATLSDGMGSGVKANVLANLTAKMGQRFVQAESDLRRNAEAILNTLPVCRERKISYATFTLADIAADGRARLIEYDNPPALWTKRGRIKTPERRTHELGRPGAFKEELLYFTDIPMEVGDRLIFCSDGVDQSGMGTKPYPLGWRQAGLSEYIEKKLAKEPEMSAGELARSIAQRAVANDGYQARDDVSCVVAYLRMPRKLLLVTGPPYDGSKDGALAQKLADFSGHKVISGGTTASIIGREWTEPISVNLRERSRDVPPSAHLKGVDLVTEGMITLGKTADLLEKHLSIKAIPEDPAERLTTMLKKSDEVSFIVGTRINEAHHDPGLPVELGIRRSLVERIRRALEDLYLKKTDVTYI